MFGRKKDGDMGGKDRDEDDEDRREVDHAGGNDDAGQAPPLKPFSRRGSHAPTKPPSATSYGLETPRRPPDIPTGPSRRPERPRATGDLDSRRLLVGRDIQLAGEITSCDKLVVEGQVEVTLAGARALEIASSGVFKGKAEVEEADISGRFEGELIARDRLVVRSGGRVRGSIRYGRIVIESGGEISGDMQTLDAGEETGKDAEPETTADDAKAKADG